MTCKNMDCLSTRILNINSNTADRFFASFEGQSFDGYPPKIAGITGYEKISMDVCLECGQVQGKFPVETPVELAGDMGDEI